jgi:hypothetical protein
MINLLGVVNTGCGQCVASDVGEKVDALTTPGFGFTSKTSLVCEVVGLIQENHRLTVSELKAGIIFRTAVALLALCPTCIYNPNTAVAKRETWQQGLREWQSACNQI